MAETSGLSRWFYLGIAAIVIGAILIFKSRANSKSKMMENGYFIFILGWVGVISEWTDFATVLFVFVLISGSLILIDKIWGNAQVAKLEKPHYIVYSYELFPIVLIVFILRAFLFEAYQIPSSSMRPDLSVGDFILVNKFDYGIREPITNKVIIPIHQVRRGDVVVFKDPQAFNRDLIKRVVGLPGDKIEYYNKKLTINGKALSYTDAGTYEYSDARMDFKDQMYTENLTGVLHKIITWDKVPTLFDPSQVIDFKYKENCTYEGESGFTCTVPEGHYFMMGDNRDDSLDSRYWGFVSEKAILGRAFFVWMNFHDLSRIGIKI